MMSFEQIDALRRQNSLTRLAVYQRAGVHSETWRRLGKGGTAPNTRTLSRLTDAITQLIREKRGEADGKSG